MLLQYIDNDCHNKILSYLCYLDQLCYKMINKTSYEKVMLNFRELFIKRLLQHEVVPNYDLAIQFCDKLNETGAIIAGSFIIDVLCGTDVANDIDCYDLTTYNEGNLVHRRQILNSEKYNNGVTVGDFFHDFGDQQRLCFTQYLYQADFWCIEAGSTPDIRIRSYVHSSQASKVRKGNDLERNPYLLPNVDPEKRKNFRHSLQIIPIGMVGEHDNIKRFINATFDLEICQNYFDGKRVYIKNLHKMVKRFCEIKPNTKFMFSVYIGEKDRVEHSVLERINKYMKRGFNIKLHPQYNKMKEDIDNLVNNGYDHGRNYDIWKHIATGEVDLSKYDT